MLEAVLMVTWIKNKKMIHVPQFYYIKVGFKGVYTDMFS